MTEEIAMRVPSTKRPNLFAPDVVQDPFPLYAALRQQPVAEIDPGGMWAVARYDDVQHVLKNPQLFSSAGFRTVAEKPWLPGNPIAQSLIMHDPPTHTRLRGLVGRAFSASAMARLEERVRAIAEGLADGLAGGEAFDFMARFALPLPARVITEILGLDPALHVEFKRWVTDLNAVAQPVLSDAQMAAAQRAVAELRAYLTAAVEERRRRPADDMISDLLAPSESGDRLTEEELLAFLSIVLMAGFETTTNLLAGALRVLIAEPALGARLRADRGLLPAFVEEALRYDAPAPAVLRLATEEVELGGARIPAGGLVCVLLASANRDERRFERPEVFDIDRAEKKHVAFGYGAHACIGAVLARMEARIGLAALLERFDGFEAAGAADFIPSFVLRGPAVFPVRGRRASLSRAA